METVKIREMVVIPKVSSGKPVRTIPFENVYPTNLKHTVFARQSQPSSHLVVCAFSTEQEAKAASRWSTLEERAWSTRDKKKKQRVVDGFHIGNDFKYEQHLRLKK